MNNILEIFLSTVVSTAILTFIIQLIIKNSLNHVFDKKLEKFKTDLNLIIEQEKYHYQRRFHDFSLYSNRRHEIYPKYFSMLVKAQSRITAIIVENPDFTKTTEKNIRRIFSEGDIEKFKIEDAIQLWKKDIRAGSEELSKLYTKISFLETEKMFIESHNYLLLSELYFSEKTYFKAKEIDTMLNKILIDRKMIIFDGIREKEIRQDISKTRDSINQEILVLKKLLKEDLVHIEEI
ncbi:hypothetical protein F9U64_01245 [Gracilibacillus oryzae]|uniref:Uncharacterized protein n=1 Tax=Gracilibacillus oryzae TaxID=1672701 RepID=A0A7C8KWY0_9BACI|nr:hypothetical protein [Gracilibacillus oryzae]KAB8139278.1 hypothetical protein F9U64_01245 [Gracilibacillus oryzae]